MRRPLEYALCWSVISVSVVVMAVTVIPTAVCGFAVDQFDEARRVLGEMKRRDRDGQ